MVTILEAANGRWLSKTQIFYVALSYRWLKKYISFLIENGLLEYNSGNKTYRTTKKGINFVKAYRSINQYFTNSMKTSNVV